MTTRCLAKIIRTTIRTTIRSTIAIATLAVAGCGGGSSNPPEAFAIDGAWIYLGPSDVPHDLTISDGAMVYTDVDGMWSSHWTIKAYDNALHHFQVTFDSGSGSYLPVGQSMSGSFELTGSNLTTQLSNGLSSYPPLESPGSCTAAADGSPIPECRVYIKAPS
jgi:hypothetical protein